MLFLKLVITAISLTTAWSLPQKLNQAHRQGEISISARLKGDPSSGFDAQSFPQHQGAQRRTTVQQRIERRAEPRPDEPGHNPASPGSNKRQRPPMDKGTIKYLREMTETLTGLIEGLSLPIAKCMSIKVWDLKLQGRDFDMHDLHRIRVECEEDFARRLQEAGFDADQDFTLPPELNGAPDEDEDAQGPHSRLRMDLHPKKAFKDTLNLIGKQVNSINTKVRNALRPSGAQEIKPAGVPAGVPAGTFSSRPLAW